MMLRDDKSHGEITASCGLHDPDGTLDLTYLMPPNLNLTEGDWLKDKSEIRMLFLDTQCGFNKPIFSWTHTRLKKLRLAWSALWSLQANLPPHHMPAL